MLVALSQASQEAEYLVSVLTQANTETFSMKHNTDGVVFDMVGKSTFYTRNDLASLNESVILEGHILINHGIEPYIFNL